MAKQRFGQVPLLVDTSNGRNLAQSAAILEYLADTVGKFGGSSLDERLQAREWLYWDFDRLAPSIYRSRGIRLGFRKGGPDVVEMYAGDCAAALAVLDRHLAGRTWIVGEGVTIADIDIYGVLGFAGEAGVDMAPFPQVAAWMQRMEALPGFRGPHDLLPQESVVAA